MGTQTDLLIEARNNGNWVTRATNQALETALVGLCVEFKSGETEQIRTSDLRVVNIRNAIEQVLEETCAVAVHDLPAWVLDEYEAVNGAGVNTDETGFRWSTVNRRYERTVTDVGTVEWRGPRFKPRPPEPREGERYDYEGHPIRPTAISLMVLREMSVKLQRATLTEKLDSILKSTSVERQIVAGGVVSNNSTAAVTRRKTRDALALVVDIARDKARNRNDAVEVWSILVVMAKSDTRPFPLLGFAENEVSHGDEFDPSYLTRDAFGQRMKRALQRDSRIDANRR